MRYSIFIIFLVALLPYCEKDHESDCAAKICTMEYRTLNILVKKSTDNSPVILTSYKVFRVSDNTDFTITDNYLNANQGYYPLVNDSDLQMLKNKNTEIEFQGFLDNILAIKQRLIVTADCCHVSLVSGETTVYI
jgi:hypothetical protein